MHHTHVLCPLHKPPVSLPVFAGEGCISAEVPRGQPLAGRAWDSPGAFPVWAFNRSTDITSSWSPMLSVQRFLKTWKPPLKAPSPQAWGVGHFLTYTKRACCRCDGGDPGPSMHRILCASGMGQDTQVAVPPPPPVAGQATPCAHHRLALPKKDHSSPWGLHGVLATPVGNVAAMMSQFHAHTTHLWDAGVPSPPSHYSVGGRQGMWMCLPGKKIS